MADTLTKRQRRHAMQQVKSKNTGPELLVRRALHAQGFRYRLHRQDLPGKPDLAFPSRRVALFINGCFWHGHDCPRGARVPKTNRSYWEKKIARNKVRDASNVAQLEALGWRAVTLWECELKRLDVSLQRVLAIINAEDDA